MNIIVQNLINYITLLLIAILALTGCDQSDQKIKLPPPYHLFSFVPADHSGITFRNTITQDSAVNYLAYEVLFQGAGAGLGDLDNDGDLDIVLVGNQSSDRIYINEGDFKFELLRSFSKNSDNSGWHNGVSIGDLNQDGWDDIYICRYSIGGPRSLSENLLYINNGDLTFTERAKEYGLNDRGNSVQSVLWDYDKDGDLDIYVCNQPPGHRMAKMEGLAVDYAYSDHLYQNIGNGKFKNVTEAAGMLNYTYTLSATPSDINNDGLTDLYVACDYEEADFLYINNGDGSFRNELNKSIRHISNFAMGSDIADINNDLYPDIFTADMAPQDNKRSKTTMSGMVPEKFWGLVAMGFNLQYMFNSLQLNQGNGVFSEVAQLSGVSHTDWSWASVFFDFDNDGYKDLLVTNGLHMDMRNNDFSKKMNDKILEVRNKAEAEGLKQVYLNPLDIVKLAPSTRIRNYIYKNNGDLTFKELSVEWGLKEKVNTQAAAIGDLDNDGDLDLVFNNTEEKAFLYENHATQFPNNYIQIRLKSHVKGRNVFNSKVFIYHGEKKQYIETTPSRGYISSCQPVAQFGLGADKKVDRIEVIWPNNQMTVLTDIEANQILEIDDKNTSPRPVEPQNSTLFKTVNQLDWLHKENAYNDFENEILIPHKMSTLGPFMAKGDVNGDGREDLFIGGARTFSAALYIQNENGNMEVASPETFEKDSKYEDMGATFFDADNDGDLDLYVVSGGNEELPGHSTYQDRLYSNDGSGNFRISNSLPKITISGSCVEPFDFDKDGDLDLFVGGRQTPQKYPYPTSSLLLVNENGKFSDKTKEFAPALIDIGMVTDASWTDYDKDGNTDLILVGEWMPITFLKNTGHNFETQINEVHKTSTGWWNHIHAADFDNDGDDDYLVGNLGTNIKYKATLDEPFQVFSKDFDSNGTNDIYLGFFQDGKCYPVRGRSCSSDQMPFVLEKFPNYELFGEATVYDVLGEDTTDALHYEAHLFESVFMINQGGGEFNLIHVPNEAQISVINASIYNDFDGDGIKDFLIAGNNYQREVETARSDAGVGLLLKGDGKGGFIPEKPYISGFYAYFDARDMELIRTANQTMIVVSNNQGPVQTYVLN